MIHSSKVDVFVLPIEPEVVLRDSGWKMEHGFVCYPVPFPPRQHPQKRRKDNKQVERQVGIITRLSFGTWRVINEVGGARREIEVEVIIEIGDSVVHSLRFLIGVGELQIMLMGISNQ
jgi:hypothetical protein